MADAEVAMLYKAASSLQQAGDTKSLTLLRSYYLMRCKDITKGYSLPDKHFSSKARCSKCCIEWRKGTETKTKSLKLSKKQRRRIRPKKGDKLKKDQIQKRIELLKSNEIEQICSFCRQTTVSRVPKPEKVSSKSSPINSNSHKNIIKEPQLEINIAKNKEVKRNNKKKNQIKHLTKNTKKAEVNVYSNTTEVFSLNNNKNTLNSNKEGQKMIKNSKKKKDKFAGLCQRAVLASAKLKEEKTKQDKINLFLKPSS